MESQGIPASLLEKRAELAQRVESIDREREALIADIEALDCAAAVFDRTYMPTQTAAAKPARSRNRSRVRPPSAVPFMRNELPTLIGQILRSADGPLATGAVAAAVADRKEIPANDAKAREWLVARVGVSLSQLERGRAVAGIRTPGDRNIGWTAAR